MFKTLSFASVLTIFGAVSSVSAAESLHVNVPFAFMAGGAKLAAGEYNITQSDNGMVTFVGTKTSAMFLTVPADYTKEGGTALSFTSTESSPVLTGIQITGSLSRGVPLHEAERKAILASAR